MKNSDTNIQTGIGFTRQNYESNVCGAWYLYTRFTAATTRHRHHTDSGYETITTILV